MTTERTPSAPADVCIIGSGPAGAMLAASLAQRDHEVVILEAGPRFDPEDRVGQLERALRPEHDDASVWDMGSERDRFTSSGAVPYDLNSARVKGVGGTTLHWGAMTPRLHPEDFEMQTRHGVARDWPLSYDTLEPYYLRAERAMGVSGAPNPYAGPQSGSFPLPPAPASYSDELIGEACKAMGIDLHPIPRAINTEPHDGRSECVGYGTCTPVCPSGAKYDASVHVRKAEAAGARLVDRAPVQGLEHDAAGDRVTAAVYATPDGTTHRQRANHFVVACGAVETVRLLLLSRSSQYPDGLANSSGVLGRYFMEHLGLSITGRLDEPTRQHLIGYSTRMSEQFYDYDSGPEGSFLLKLSNTAGPSPMDAAFERDHRSGALLLEGDVDAPYESKTLGSGENTSPADQTTNHVSIRVVAEQLPDPANRVSLDRSKTDDHGNPVPDISFSIGQRTRDTLACGEEIAREILADLGASEVTANRSPDGDPWPTNHHMGVTRMGTVPGESVVDTTLQAHDLENCYISSSGTFVTAGVANPTLTIAALTLRLADHLDAKLTGA